MQAAEIDQSPLLREKPSTSTETGPLVTGHSGGDVNEIGEDTTSKLTIDEYKEQVQLDGFKVADTPKFIDSGPEDEDIDHVQSKSTHPNNMF